MHLKIESLLIYQNIKHQLVQRIICLDLVSCKYRKIVIIVYQGKYLNRIVRQE